MNRVAVLLVPLLLVACANREKKITSAQWIDATDAEFDRAAGRVIESLKTKDHVKFAKTHTKQDWTEDDRRKELVNELGGIFTNKARDLPNFDSTKFDNVISREKAEDDFIQRAAPSLEQAKQAAIAALYKKYNVD
jgi:hypothetical protein